MAEKKDVLLSLTVDIGDSANRIAGLTTIINQLTDAEKDLKKQMADTDTTTKQGKEAYADLARQLATVTESKKAYAAQLRDESKVVQNTIKATGEYERSLQGMADKLAAAKKELRSMNMYLEDGKTIDPQWKAKANEVDNLNKKVKEAEEAYGVYARNVGNYSNSILDAFSKMPPGISKTVGSVKTLKLGFDALGKTPVLAILGLLVSVITKVTDALEGSEENTNAMTAALAPFKAITDLVTVSLQKMGEWLGKATKAMTAFVRKHADEYAILGKVNERMKERQEIAERELELTQMNRANIVDNAKDEQRVAELRAKAADKTANTARQRLEYLQEAADIEERISQRNVESATKEYELLKLQAEQAGNSKEENDALAQAEAKMIQARTAYFNKTRELAAQMSETRKQIAADAKAQAEEARRADEEAKKAAEDAAKAMQEMVDKVREMALGDTLEYQIEQVEKKYGEAIEGIKNNSKVSAEESAYYRELLEQKMAAEIAAIRQKPIDEQLKKEKAAADEAVKAREAALATELAQNWQNAQAQYDIRKKYIEELLKDESIAADKRYELEKELADMQAENAQKRIDALVDYAGQMQGILGSITDIAAGFEERQTRKVEDENDKQKESLQKRLDAGIISQEQYDARVAKLDADLDAQKAEITRKQAARQKALSAMEIAINTATAIMKIWAEVPKMDFGISTGVLTAAAAAAGAAQLAAVISEPLPKAAKGGRVSGPSHAGGGVVVNTEGDERIVAANPSRAFPELLNLISYIGKHSSVPETGYAMRAEMGVNDYERLAKYVGEAVKAAVADLNISVSVTEINEVNDRLNRIIASAKQ